MYYLHAVGGATPAGMVGHGLPDDINGQPCAYFWKPAIKVGAEYVHPTHGYKVPVPPDRADAWLGNFRRMRANGVKVPICRDHSSKAEDALGWVVDARRNGDWLELLHQFVGADAVALAARNDVSLGIDPNFTDGTGTAYGDAIVHSALTPVPVVPRQGGFIQIDPFVPLSRNASGPAEAAPVYTLSTPVTPDMQRSDTTMPTAEQLQRARDRLGRAELKPEEAFDSLLSAVETTDSEARQFRRERDEARAELSRANPPAPAKPTASELYWMSRAVAAARDQAVRGGAITPAVADKAQARFLRKAVRFDQITLSREVEADDHQLADGLARLMEFYETVQGNVPTPTTGAVTGPQGGGAIHMSREGDDGNGANPWIETAQAMYGGRG